MKTATAVMQTHLGQDVTALATCWIIDREDGITKRFTDHDQDIPIGGDIYSSIGAYKRTSIETTDTLSVDNLDIEGISNELALPRDDLVLGTYDNATIRVFMTSWDGTDTGELKLRRGFFGQVQTLPNGTFSVELRGVLQHLAHTYTKLYTATCLYDLGESDCGVPIQPLLVQRSTAYALGDAVSGDPDFGGSSIRVGDVFKLSIIGPSFEGLSGNLSNSIGWYGSSGAPLVLGVPSPEGAKDGFAAIKGGTTDGTIAQDVGLLAAGVSAANIDAGNVYMSLFGWRIGDNDHTGRLIFYGLDAKLNVINTIYDSTAETLDNTDGWVRRGGYDLPIPQPEQSAPTFGTDISFSAPDTITYTAVSGSDISFTAPDLMDSASSAFGDLPNGSVVVISGSASNDGTYTTIVTTAAQVQFVEQTIVAEGVGSAVTVTRSNVFGTLTAGDTVKVSGSAANDGTYEIDTISSTQITTVEQTLATEAAGATVILTELKFTRFVRISYEVTGTSADQYLDNIYGWLIDASGAARLTYTKGDVFFETTTAGTTAATLDVQGYSYTLCDFTKDGTAIFFTQPAWTRGGEVTSSTGHRIFDITVLEGRGFTGWYDGGLITFETGKNAGASMEIRSWISPGPIINPVFREKLTTGTSTSSAFVNGSWMYVDWNRGTAGTVYMLSTVTTQLSSHMTVWDLASLSVLEVVDLTVTGVNGEGYFFNGIDPDTGYLVGAEDRFGDSKFWQFVYDPVNDIKITELELFATPSEQMHDFDTTYAFMKHASSGNQAVMSYNTENVRAHSFPALVKKNEWDRSANFQPAFMTEGGPGEVYGAWQDDDVILFQKYVIQSDGTVVENFIGSLNAAEVGPGGFNYQSNRIRIRYDPDNLSLHCEPEMTGDGFGTVRAIGWSITDDRLLYSTLIDPATDSFGTSDSMHRIGNNKLCWDAQTNDSVFCVDTVTGEVTKKSTYAIDGIGPVLWDGVNQALYTLNSIGSFDPYMEVRKPLVEGTRLGTIELYLSMPFPVEAGDLFSIYPGCDKTRTSCAAIFDNVVNMFGAPDAPGHDAILSVPDAK